MEDTELEGDMFPRADQVDTERWTGEDAIVQQRSKSNRIFDGGVGMCSGRYAAEREVIGLVSKLLMLFGIEFEDSWKDKFHFDPRSLRIMHPADPPLIRLKRRVL
ncbi:hypothetical protein LTR81_027918 [Elasticomyces elasticus]